MNEVMYYTYIVASRSHNFYVGMTSDIEARVWQHKNGVFEGHSKKYNSNRLVWFERHPFVQNAGSGEAVEGMVSGEEDLVDSAGESWVGGFE